MRNDEIRLDIPVHAVEYVCVCVCVRRLGRRPLAPSPPIETGMDMGAGRS